MKDTECLEVCVDVTNMGRMFGREIVELYVAAKESSVVRPVKELKGFAKIACAPGETRRVVFTLDKRSFAYFEKKIGDWYVESGKYEVLVGASSADIRARASVMLESTCDIPRKYDKFVTMGELMQNPVGCKIIAESMEGGGVPAPTSEDPVRLDDEEDMEDVAMDYVAMGMDMPLCKVADMTDGKYSDAYVDEVVAALNGENKT